MRVVRTARGVIGRPEKRQEIFRIRIIRQPRLAKRHGLSVGHALPVGRRRHHVDAHLQPDGFPLKLQRRAQIGVLTRG